MINNAHMRPIEQENEVLEREIRQLRRMLGRCPACGKAKLELIGRCIAGDPASGLFINDETWGCPECKYQETLDRS